MINGNPNDFLDTIYSCQDVIYKYDGIQYWFQGYTNKDGTKHMEILQDDPPSERYIWEYNDKTLNACLDAFINAPIFNGKTFREAESRIEWID